MSKNLKTILIAVVILLVGVVVVSGYTDFDLSDIGKSHIDANVPSDETFDEYLARDLQAYYSSGPTNQISIDYSLLREAPTQSGTAFPKYYVWVTVNDESSNLLGEYAVRVAAQEQQKFQVTDSVSLEEIRSNPTILDAIFPTDVIEEIQSKIN